MDNPTYCRACLRKNDVTATQCAFCGAPLQDNVNVHTTLKVAIEQVSTYRPTAYCEEYLPLLPEDTFALFVMDQEKPLFVHHAPRITLGRMLEKADESSVSFPEEEAVELGVSRRHAQIVCEDGRYYLVDLHSTNGTWLNRQKLVPEVRYPLHSEDIVTLGRLRLLLCARNPQNGQTISSQEVTLHIMDSRHSLQTAWQRLTPSYLTHKLGLYLQAVADLQMVIKRCRGRMSLESQIRSIQADETAAAIVVTLSSVAEAVAIITKWIVPWRESAKTDADATLQQHLTLNQLADAIIGEAAPDLPVADHMQFVEMLKPPLTLLANGDLTLLMPESPDSE